MQGDTMVIQVGILHGVLTVHEPNDQHGARIQFLSKRVPLPEH